MRKAFQPGIRWVDSVSIDAAAVDCCVMDISVTLFGGLRHYLPAGSSFNKCMIDVDDGSSLAALLQ